MYEYVNSISERGSVPGPGLYVLDGGAALAYEQADPVVRHRDVHRTGHLGHLRGLLLLLALQSEEDLHLARVCSLLALSTNTAQIYVY